MTNWTLAFQVLIAVTVVTGVVGMAGVIINRIAAQQERKGDR